MASPFDWSPGGCCCEKLWHLDLYASQESGGFYPSNRGNFIRGPSGRLEDSEGGPLPDYSIAPETWSIIPEGGGTIRQTYVTLAAAGMASEIVWSLEARSTPPSTNRVLNL